MEEFESPIISSQTQFELPIVSDNEYEEPIISGSLNSQVDPIIPQGIDNSTYADLNNIFSQ